MLPGHGSAFLRLPCPRRTRLASPSMTPPTPSIRRHHKCQNARRARTTNMVSCPSRPPIRVGQGEPNRGGVNAPSAVDVCKKTKKMRARCQVALRRFLATLPAIGRDRAPDHPRAHLQGVHTDSLAGFRSFGLLQQEIHRCCARFLSAQHRQLYYMYCSCIIYTIYIVLYKCMCETCGISGVMEGDANARKIKISAEGR
jgi:hypothetical protein